MTTLQTLQLRFSKTKPPRVLSGHPWVFAGEIEQPLPDSFNGQAVVLRGAQGHFLGTGIYNNKSNIIWRRFSYQRQDLSDDLLSTYLATAVQARGNTKTARLVWAEADHLPGLIVDRFNDVLVIQAQTLAMDQRLEAIAAHLKALLKDIREIVFRNDAPSRNYEGLPMMNTTLSGQPLEPTWYIIDGISYFLDLQSGQKTGFYLDQRAEHQRIAQSAKDKDMLDGFCNQGAFALHAAKAGAKSVLAIDSSESAIAAARKNSATNDLETIDFQVANMFDYLSSDDPATFDLIVLDPPSFARTRQALPGALRGYKELNLRALKRLRPGGILASYVCSHSISLEMLMGLVSEAAGDIRRDVQLLAITGQPADHPISITFPESAYLKGLILQVKDYNKAG